VEQEKHTKSIDQTTLDQLPNLLIVDDFKDNLFLLETLLKKFNINLIIANSGTEALEKTSGIELALAIIDVRMPVMNGYELAMKMNERSNEKVPVIFLTASHFDEIEMFKGYGLGAVDYIFKPIDNNLLLSKINVFLDLFEQKQTIIGEAIVLKKYANELTRVNNALNIAKDQAEVAFRKYSELFDLAPSGYISLSSKREIQDLNLSGAIMLGKERSFLIGSQFNHFVAKSNFHEFNFFFKNVFKSKTKEICELELNINGHQPKFVHIEGMLTGDGKQCLMSVVDITQRKLAEQTLEISEKKYRSMLNASPDGILIIDLKGVISEVSDIGLELFGADSRDEMVGKKLSIFVSSEENKTIKEMIDNTMIEGRTQNIGLRIRKKDKTLFPGELSATLIQGPQGAPLSFMIIIRDISQRKKAETLQLHADRMANLGEMASGIAHEINQPLNIISMVLDKILFETARNENVNVEFIKEKSDKIFENIIRIRNIIDHIRAFSRSHDDYVLAEFSINTSIENGVSMITEQYKHLGITLDLQLEQQIPQIVGNTYKFEQVIVNLLANAKDAVIERKNKDPEYDNMIVGIRSFQVGPSIIVEIEDNGIGISDDDLDNVILPFYTTKDEGKGTGLGLSICYQIIREMGGTIDIISNISSGTKIIVDLVIKKRK
jgi:PAS domain S-box-containing protein